MSDQSKKTTTTKQGRIRIIKIPDGEAPLYIRAAWVRLILPCDPYFGHPDLVIETGVLSDEPKPSRSSFGVPQDMAISILRESNPQAALWWNQRGFPQPGGYFGFAEDEAEIIEGVTRQQAIEVTEEMMGQPDR